MSLVEKSGKCTNSVGNGFFDLPVSWVYDRSMASLMLLVSNFHNFKEWSMPQDIMFSPVIFYTYNLTKKNSSKSNIH